MGLVFFEKFRLEKDCPMGFVLGTDVCGIVGECDIHKLFAFFDRTATFDIKVLDRDDRVACFEWCAVAVAGDLRLCVCCNRCLVGFSLVEWHRDHVSLFVVVDFLICHIVLVCSMG